MCLNVKYYGQKANEQNEELRFFFSLPTHKMHTAAPRIGVHIESWVSCIVTPPVETAIKMFQGVLQKCWQVLRGKAQNS